MAAALSIQLAGAEAHLAELRKTLEARPAVVDLGIQSVGTPAGGLQYRIHRGFQWSRLAPSMAHVAEVVEQLEAEKARVSP